jgi:outer membrane receptor protein involved in Fe transport
MRTLITIIAIACSLQLQAQNDSIAADSVTWEKQLDGVTVVHQKKLVKMETDKMTYKVSLDEDAKTATVLDMLRKVPMVTVDGQDNISVNGSSAFQVYVDGKPNPMMTANASVIFKSMPATAVKDIEVVTNPGARYDAEGAGGVLNIIMNRQNGMAASLDGYNGSLRAVAGTNALGAGAFLSGQKGKLSYSANANYNHMHPKTTEVVSTRTANDGSTMASTTSSKTKIPFTMGSISIGYEIDSVSNINASASLTSFEMSNKGNSTVGMYGGLYGQGFNYGYDMDMKNRKTAFTGSLDYQRFLNKDRTSQFAITYVLSLSPTKNETTNIFDSNPLATIDLTNQRSDSRENTTEHILQADYTTPISEKSKFNTGLKLTARKATTDADHYLGGVYSDDASMEYSHTNNIAAAYAEYEQGIGKFTAKGGLRYEHTWQEVKYEMGNGANFSTDYGNLVPSASLSYPLSMTSNIGLTYNMRITRPGISFLNPYVDTTTPTARTYGNPDLSTEKSNNIGLVFNFYTPKLMLSAKLNQNFYDDGIEQYSFYQDGILNTTYGNIMKKSETGGTVFANWLLHKDTRLFINGGLTYAHITSDQLDAKNHGWQANVMAGVQQTLPLNLKLSAYLIASSKTHTLQGWNSGFNMLIANISKSFLDDRLSVGITANTGLGHGGKITIDSYSKGADFTNLSNISVPMQNISLNVTFNFGNTKRQAKQHVSRVQSDFIEQQSKGEMLNDMGTTPQ